MGLVEGLRILDGNRHLMITLRGKIKSKLVTKVTAEHQFIIIQHHLERLLVHSAEVELFLGDSLLQGLGRLHERRLRTLILSPQFLFELR